MWPRFKVDFLTTEYSDLGGGSFQLKQNVSQVYPATWVPVNSSCSQVDNQEQPSQAAGNTESTVSKQEAAV